jgi:hypothetical protein
VAGGKTLLQVATSFLDAGDRINDLLGQRGAVPKADRSRAAVLRAKAMGLLNRLRDDLPVGRLSSSGAATGAGQPRPDLGRRVRISDCRGRISDCRIRLSDAAAEAPGRRSLTIIRSWTAARQAGIPLASKSPRGPVHAAQAPRRPRAPDPPLDRE